MILIDFSYFLHRQVFSLLKDKEPINSELIYPDYNELYKSILRSIRIIEDKFSEDYGRIVICNDSKDSWRNDYFKYYKAKRKESREKDIYDWNKIYEHFENIKKDLKDNTSYIVLSIDRLEGDDCIAFLCKYRPEKEKNLIVSVDKDLNQLIQHKWVHQWSPLTNDFVAKDINKLKELILKGDASDNIPNIFSDDDHFMKEEKTRAQSVTSKLIESINIESENLVRSYFFDNPNIEKIIKNFNRNKKLIDLTLIPEEYDIEFKKQMKNSILISNQNKNTHNDYCWNILNDINEKDILNDKEILI